jgi:methyl-accepting chemotaxis protein
VVSALLSGTPYTGRAYVVNGWYLTTYRSLRDETQQVVGALYGGVPQESVKSLREQIMAATIGTTGYMYVLDTQGHYVISKDGKRDGGKHLGGVGRRWQALHPGDHQQSP